MIRNMFQFLRGGVVSTSPNPPKLEDHSLSAVRDCLFNTLTATLHLWRPFLLPQPEDAPCRGERDTLNGKAFSVTVSVGALIEGPVMSDMNSTEKCRNVKTVRNIASIFVQALYQITALQQTCL